MFGVGFNFLKRKVFGAPAAFDMVEEFGADLRFYDKVRGELGISGDNTISRLGNNENINALLDFRNRYVQTSDRWISNFTAGVDSVTEESNITSLGFNQTIGGESGWLKTTLNSVDGIHEIRRVVSAGGAGQKETIKIYIPSDNVLCDGLRCFTEENVGERWYKDLSTNTIHEVELNAYCAGTGTTLRMIMLAGSSSSFDGNDDVIYIKSFNLTNRDGTEMIQDTAADVGLFATATQDVLLDGISDRYDCFANWADIAADTKGSMHFHFKDLEGSGAKLRPIDFGMTVTQTERLFFELQADNKFRFKTSVASSNTEALSDSVVARGGNMTMGFWSDGSTSKMYFNGLSIPHTWDGEVRWAADIGAIQEGFIGSDPVGGEFYNMRMKGIVITGGNVLTDTQAMQIHQDLSA